MKKTLIIIGCFILIILSTFGMKYINYKYENSKIKLDNLEYETYLNKEVTGRDLTTAINKAVDSNEKNSVPKDENGFYIENENNSIEIEIKISDNDTTYKMETLYNGGMVSFIQYYGDIMFKCSNIEYNNSKKVKHLSFEQVSN